jgi:hypothetical protein
LQDEQENLELDFGDEKSSELYKDAGHQWLIPIILATQEAEIKRIPV